MVTPSVDDYVKFYEGRTQVGGGSDYPVFAGARSYQYGSGIGDVFRKFFRWVMPVASAAGTSFLGEMAKSKSSGADWGKALASGIAPAASAAINTTIDQIQHPYQKLKEKIPDDDDETKPLIKQKGKGVKRKQRSKYKKAKRARISYDNWKF